MRILFALLLFATAAAAQHAPNSRRIMMEPPLDSGGGGGSPIYYDYLRFQGLTHFMNTTGGTSVVTASFRPTNDANCIFIAFTHMTHATAPVSPTVTSTNGLTWTKIADTNFGTLTVPTHNGSAYWAQGVGIGTSNQVKADFGATTATGAGITVVQFENALLGAGVIVQTSVVGSNATANPQIVLTATTRAGTNAMVKVVFDSVASTADSTAETGNRWAEYAEDGYSTPAAGTTVDYSLAVFPSLTLSTNKMTSRDWAAVLVEVQPKTLTGQTNYGDIVIDGTNSIGSALTAAILTNSTRGQWNGWTPKFATLTNFQIAASSHTLHTPLRLGTSTFYPAGVASYAFAYSNIVDSVTADLTMSSPPNNPVCQTWGWLTPGMTNGTAATGQLFDFVAIYGNASGEYVALQIQNGIGSSNAYAINIETNPSGVTTHSGYITLVTNAPYIPCIQGDFLAGIAKFNIYSNDFSLMASFSSAMSKQATSLDTDFGQWRWGQNETGKSSGQSHFEVWVTDFSTQRWPPIP